jgi:hypothetical protein
VKRTSIGVVVASGQRHPFAFRTMLLIRRSGNGGSSSALAWARVPRRTPTKWRAGSSVRILGEMRRSAVLTLVIGAALCLAYGASTARSRTEVVGWSPFTSAGHLRASLRVSARRGGCSDIGYTLMGGIGYRCAWGNTLAPSCYRDGSNETDFAICVDAPWDRDVVRLQSSYLTYYPGVTYSPAADYPWALVLMDGNRCRLILTGSGPIPTPKGPRRADYGCERGGVELADLQRNHSTWRVSAVSFKSSGYGPPRYVSVRRAYMGWLPPAMARQNKLAGRAYQAATRVIRSRNRRAQLDLSWVRTTLPQADWAFVLFEPADGTRHGWYVVLQRLGQRWVNRTSERPYCTKLPARVRHQLFLPAKAPDLGAVFMAPTGEPRC